MLQLSNIPLCMYMHHNLLIHSAPNGHLGRFRVFPIVNNAAMNLGCVCVCVCVLSNHCLHLLQVNTQKWNWRLIW